MWKIILINLAVLATSLTTFSNLAFAHGGNGGTPTTEPPEISSCDNGILSIDVGEPWETAPRKFSIEVDIIDFTDNESQFVILERITNAEITIADGSVLEVGEKFRVPAGKTVLGHVSLIAPGTGSFTFVSFDEKDANCKKTIDLKS